MFSFIVVLACGLFALYYAYDTSKRVFSAGTGTEEMQKIAGAIQEGAQAYLNRQYKTIAIVGVIVAVLLAWALSGLVALGFVLGAVLSGVAGYIGMNVSVRANIRTTEAARQGMTPALNVAFQAGAVTGLLVVGLGLLGVVLYYGLLTMFGVEQKTMLEALVALSFGASLISIFARLGGGIFTKGADVGADLVGKVEAGIPEDDPRNPAVIADNVGDNVGDCAGMAADLFETYAVTVVATMLLAAIYFTGELQHLMMMYPLLIGGVCILGSVFGTKYVRLGSDNNIMKALYRGLTVAALASAGLIIVVTFLLFWGAPEMQIQGKTFGVGNLLMCSLTGLVITAALVWITEYYTATAFRPVRSIAQASTTGHGTNVIQGLAVSMESTALPVIVISIGILFSYSNAGLFGIAITGNASVATIFATAIMAIVASFVAPFVTFLATIPNCVMGGVCITLYGFIAVSGLKMIQEVDLGNNKNLFVVSVILIAGIGGLTLNFGKVTITSVACALILGIITNVLCSIGGKKEEETESVTAEDATIAESMETEENSDDNKAE